MSKDDIEKLEEQEMKKLKSIIQDEMGEKPKLIRDKLKDTKINDISTIFETEKEKEDRKKKKRNEKIINKKIIRDIRTLFDQEEVIFGIIIILSMKVMVIKIETYH